jgi:ribonuclease E
MLETERHDREPDNDDKTASAGHAAGVTPDPAEAREGADPADPGGSQAGGGGRRLFRRGRRAATRPAGPPAEDPDSGPAQADRGAGADGGAGAVTAPPPGPAVTAQAPAAGSAPTGPAQGSAPGSAPAGPARGSAPAAEFTAAATAPPGAPGTGAAESGTAPAEAGSQVPQVPQPTFQPPLVVFQAPDIASGGARLPRAGDPAGAPDDDRPAGAGEQDDDDGAAGGGAPGKRRRRGGRSHAKGRGGADAAAGEDARQGAEASDGGESDLAGSGAPAADGDTAAEASDEASDEPGASGKRRRRRRRTGHSGDGDAPAADDPPNTVVHVRSPRAAADDDSDVRGVKGSTRLEAKRQRRREGRESGRRRPPIITESEFLARREAVERVMVVRQHADRTQIAVLEDGILVEHYVDTASHQSYVGNVYLGRVQNVLPSMEAAFVDIGKGRNAVLYAGEVNFDASGLEGESKRIESALKSGQSILVQATKDPIGHKGARLTSQVSLPGRYLVYVPGASMTGISRKLPDTERTRLKQILKQVMPEDAGVIVRTAAEGATEEELSHDVARLAAQWEAIERKAKTASAPELLYSEPDLTIRVVRDIFNEDFSKLVIASDGDWDMVDEYVRYVAPNLAGRLERWTSDKDVFAEYRIDEQIAKALERKVWLPSGGSLVIDTTEAMTVIDVNTGKFTGQGGNLEQTVTRNNLEAAEEIVRQLRVRDVGGIIVIDFIDMVLESNRDLVLRRLLECLARDRTKHQVAEVTSLGLVQMTRKRVGSGLLEAFSVPCDCCNGRGVIVSLDPVDHAPASDRQGKDGGRGRGPKPSAPKGRGSSRSGKGGSSGEATEDGSAKPPEQADGEPAGRTAANGDVARADVPGGVAAGEATGGSQAAAGSGAAGGEMAGGDAAGGDVAGGDVAGGDGNGAGSRQASGGRRRRRPSGSRASAATQAVAVPEAAGAGAQGTATTDAAGVADGEGGSGQDGGAAADQDRSPASQDGAASQGTAQEAQTTAG